MVKLDEYDKQMMAHKTTHARDGAGCGDRDGFLSRPPRHDDALASSTQQTAGEVGIFSDALLETKLGAAAYASLCKAMRPATEDSSKRRINTKYNLAVKKYGRRRNVGDDAAGGGGSGASCASLFLAPEPVFT